MHLDKSLILKGLALAAVLFFFLPFFTVSCNSDLLNEDLVTLNGVKIMTGISSGEIKAMEGKDPSNYGYSDEFNGNLTASFLLLLPVAMIVLTLSKLKNNDVMVLSAAVICILLCLYLRADVINKAGSQFVEIKNEMGFYLTILAHLGIIGYVVYDIFFAAPAESPGTDSNTQQIPDPLPKKTETHKI